METITLWKDQDRRIIDPRLFSDKAEKLAMEIGAQAQKKKINKGTQLRRFYDEVVRLNNMAKERPKEWDNILPYIHMLIAKAAYAKGRGLVSEEFVKFMKDGIAQIEDRKDLVVFANFFEAFMGFYKQHNPH